LASSLIAASNKCRVFPGKQRTPEMTHSNIDGMIKHVEMLTHNLFMILLQVITDIYGFTP
jgi:hypothetical protein